MNTLLLDRQAWDLLLDASGNIALAAAPYAIAQDVASAAKLFFGELWYNVDKGMPYFEQILGKNPPLSYVRAQYVIQAKTVPEVVRAKCVITDYSNRQYSGVISFTDTTGEENNVSF